MNPAVVFDKIRNRIYEAIDSRERKVPNEKDTITQEMARKDTITQEMARKHILIGLHEIRDLVAKIYPEKCCKGAIMVAGGRKHYVCSNDCDWETLERMIATAIVDAEILRTSGRVVCIDDPGTR